MKHYQDYDEEENTIAGEAIAGVGKLDWLLAIAVAAAVFGLLALWRYPYEHPGMWTDLAVAAGTRPPQSIFPGLWRLVAVAVFKVAGIARGLGVLRLAGGIAGATSAALVYLFFRECLSISIRHRRQMARRRLFTVRVAAFVATVAFACSEPFWRAVQSFSPVTLSFLLVAFAATLFVVFLRSGSMAAAYGSVFLAGVISAETPMGFMGVAVAWAAYTFITRYGEQFAAPLVNPATAQVSKWHLTFLFVLGCIATVLVNCWSFVYAGGLKSLGDPGASVLPMQYITNHWALFAGAASLVGWLFLSVMIVLPWFVSAAMLPKATDEEHFLPYGIGLVYVVACLFAISQLGPVEGLWIWNWKLGGDMLVHSPLMMVVMALLAAASIMSAIVVLGIDGFCRDHKFIAQQQFGFAQGDDEDEDEDGYALTRPKRLSRRAEIRLGRFSRFVVVTFMLLVVPAVTLPSRYCAKAREMLGVIRDYVGMVLAETEGRMFVVTDGRFDPALEVAALANGRILVPISIMSGRGQYDTFLRLRGMTDGEDRLAAAKSASALLRTWLRDAPDRLTNCCAQVGFESWKRDGLPLPCMLGVVARPGEDRAGFIAERVSARDDLAGRVLGFYAKRRTIDSNDPEIGDLFEAVQWRLARNARFRGEGFDLAGDVAAAEKEVALGDRLDNTNASFRELLEVLERLHQNASHRLTPREGLHQALDNADFALASHYADAVLKSHPENVDANFAMGMLYYQQRQYSRAEDHLTRCLVLAPREPAVYNNLAMIQMHLRKFDAAAKNAARALELAPGSAEVLDTIRKVEDAKAAAATNALPAAVDLSNSPMRPVDKTR